MTEKNKNEKCEKCGRPATVVMQDLAFNRTGEYKVGAKHSYCVRCAKSARKP